MNDRITKFAEIIKAAEAHSKAAHDDLKVHPDCDTCLDLAAQIIKASGATPKEFLDLQKELDRDEAMLNITRAVIARTGGSAWD